ncbi:MAG: YbaY family lipoprotein [Caldilineaceae bacterium]
MTETTPAAETAMLPAEMVGVVWQWQHAEVPDPTRYTLEFMTDGGVAVQADCNRGRGTYQIVGQAFFLEVLTLTRAACGPDSLDQTFLEQVNSTDTYRLEDGTLVLTLRVAPGMTTFIPADDSAPAAGSAPADPPTLSAAEEDLVNAAMALIADETGVDAAALTVSAVEAVEWPDSSLGCPEAGMMYMQVITPGYRITFVDDSGMTYEVHTGSDAAGAMVYCTQTEDALSSELSGVLSGSVMYRQRIALPAGSVISVELQDVSRADVAANIVATQTLTTAGENVPIPFELRYDPAEINPSHTYAVRAQIKVDGELRWTSTERFSVLTNDNPTTDVTVMVMPAQ